MKHLLRTQVLQRLKKHGMSTMAVTGPELGSGVATTAANLAIAIALDVNQTVLLVDLNLRAPAIHEKFRFQPRAGIDDYLRGEANLKDCLVSPGISPLVLLPARRANGAAAEIISSPRVTAYLQHPHIAYRYRGLGLVGLWTRGHGTVAGRDLPGPDAFSDRGLWRRAVLIIDEAQNLTVEAVEELRLLSNINSDKDLLLQVILVGQPELLDKLRRSELYQFEQRISISYHLEPLSCVETKQYIQHRLQVAGADRQIISDMAIGAI